jgi:hypothetical protein
VDQWPYQDCEIEVNYGRVFNCGDDTAGNILKHLYPNIDGSTVQAKDANWMDNGQLVRFNQGDFIELDLVQSLSG